MNKLLKILGKICLIVLLSGLLILPGCEYADAGAPESNDWIGNFESPYMGMMARFIFTQSDNGTWFRVTDNMSGGGMPEIPEGMLKGESGIIVQANEGIDYLGISDNYTDDKAREAAVSNEIYGAGWNGIIDVAPSKDAVYDKIESLLVPPKITTGNYIGNSTANRAIAHGMGIIPKWVEIICHSQITPMHIFYNGELILGLGYIYGVYHDASASAAYAMAVTQMDGTNFYVGNASGYDYSMNKNLKIYYWIAYGY